MIPIKLLTPKNVLCPNNKEMVDRCFVNVFLDRFKVVLDNQPYIIQDINSSKPLINLFFGPFTFDFFTLGPPPIKQHFRINDDDN